MMDPVSLIVVALVAGAAKGVGDSATKAVEESYVALKSRLGRLFEGQPAAVVLSEHEKDPETYAAPLAKEIERSGAANDPEILEAARRLLAAADPNGTRAGEYTIGSIKADRGGVAAAHIEGGVTAGYREPSAPPQSDNEN